MTDTAAPAEQIEDRPKLQISATQITTGVVASTVSALLGSTLGVAGTLLGAALGAAVYSIAATLYSHSVATAKHRLHLARLAHGGGQIGDSAPAGSSDSDDGLAGSGDPLLSTEDLAAETIAVAASTENPTEPARPGRPRNPRRPRLPGSPHWRSVLAGSVGSAIAFGVALLLVTGLESAKGAPLSGGVAGGLTVLGGSAPVQPDTTSSVPVSTTTNVTVVHSVTQIETSTSVVSESVPAEAADEPSSDEAAEPTTEPTAPQQIPEATTDPQPPAPTTAPSDTETADAAASTESEADPQRLTSETLDAAEDDAGSS